MKSVPILDLRQALQHSDENTSKPLAPAETAVTDTDLSPPRGNPFPIVGIGASAGGLEAFGSLLSALPANSGLAFVFVQHLDPQHESVLPELLARFTSMPVITVLDGMKVEPDSVYVIPPNTSIELQDGTLRLASREPGLHLPIDIFFRSLAAVQGSRAIGVVLSGNASDGSMGVRAIKAECGITFAQSEETARFGGMPRNAVSTGAIDYILGPAEIGRELSAIARHPFLIPSRDGDSRSETLPDGDGELRRIFALLYGATKVDFSRYKTTTVRRRIGRRMMVLHIDEMAEYARYVEHHPAELRDLYRDLLISITSFFRDPDTFTALQQSLLETLSARPQSGDLVRVWVPGCATGEEVYSLAICLSEILQENRLLSTVQLFGTDISDLALERARRGFYPVAIEEAVSPERLRRFFTKIDTGYQINKAIRETCIFASHDLTRDPPFSNLDLVSCRNLLIYLEQKVQRHVLPVFHYALKPAGLLLLGSAESIAAAPDMFDVVDQQHKIYRRKSVPTQLPGDMSVSGPHMGNPPAVETGSATLELQRRLERVIQSKYSPDGVLIDSDFQIIQFRGRTGAYLDPSPARNGLNVLRIAREELVLPLRRAVQTALETNASVRERGVELQSASEAVRVTLEVTPIPAVDSERRYLLVVFAREKSSVASAAGNSPLLSSQQPLEDVEDLARELRETRDSLRNVTEQFETHAEELQAANEEARSANEELQSTNEELRTTKEELQSANEELTTVNEELQSRNSELSATNGDLINLLGAVTVSIVMVDGDLRVRRFNTAAAALLDLHPLDIGKPVGHIRGRIETPRLELQVKLVIETLHAISEEVQDAQGRWYALHIRPYRTIDDRIAGAVITLQDVDPLKRGLQAAEEARDYAEGIIETVREPLIVLDSDLRVQRATQAFYESFLVTREETVGRFIYDLGNGQWNDARLRELIGAALFRSEPFHDFELIHDFPHIGVRTVRLNGRRILLPHSQQRMLLLSIEDVTERRELAEIRYRRLFEAAKDGILVVDVEAQTIQDANPCMLDLCGCRREQIVGKPVSEAAAKLGLPELGRGLSMSSDSEIVRFEGLPLRTRQNGLVLVDVVGNAYKVGNQPVVQFNIRDVSSSHQALKRLRESEQRFRLFVESVHDYALFQTDPSGRIVTWNAGAERLLGWKEQEAIGQHTSLLFTPEDLEAGEAARELATARATGRAEDERWHLRKDGTRFYASGVLTQVCDDRGQLLGFAKIMRDNTARKEQEEQLRRTVSEKETLVREIHHRVKNNLQVIVSLLAMQSRHNPDPRVLSAFSEAESRLRAIAQIHERLYASDDLSTVEFSEYVSGLARELAQLHAPNPKDIELDINVIDMALHIERAIPLGLIANELILNSLKHGLNGRPGRLRIRLAYVPGSSPSDTLDTGWGQLQICDDGPGFPPGFDASNTQTMGLRLVNMLVRQLRGHLELGPPPGVCCTVIFPLEDLRQRQEGAADEATDPDR
jgi:two-component system CheB/CheR fusion protein